MASDRAGSWSVSADVIPSFNGSPAICNPIITALYRKRQEINKHIFGSIKRGWNYGHTNLRGLEKVNGEFALIMMVYNMRRSIHILDMPEILEKLKNWTPDYEKVVKFSKKRHIKVPVVLYMVKTKILAA